MEIKLNIKNPENVGTITPEKIAKYTEIFQVLIQTGSLDGIKGGSVAIHFDSQGVFQGPELHYWPWRRRKLDKPTTQR